MKGVEAKHRMIYISHLLNNQNNCLQHNVILANKCRSGKCGIDDDQRRIFAREAGLARIVPRKKRLPERVSKYLKS